MDEQEKKEWFDDLQKIKELTEAINVRFQTAWKTGQAGTTRVCQAYEINSQLLSIYNQITQLQTELNKC